MTLHPVNDTQMDHRGRDRRTDLAALRAMYRPGSLEWTAAAIKRMEQANDRG